MKLIADPHKLKAREYNVMKYDSFKYELETKFNYELSSTIYKHIIQVIETELIIDSVICNLINQVVLDRNP